MLGRRRSGKQISLVPRQPEHVEIIYDWFDFTDFYPNWEPPSFGQYMERYEKRAGDNDCTLWSVIRNAEEADDELDDDGEIDGEVVGITELWDFTSSRGCLESLVYIVPGARGQGYGTQVVELRAAYAFESLDVELLETTTETTNEAAQRVLEHAGYRRTGQRPHAFRENGQWRDLYFYALLREWWEALRTS